MEVCNSSPYQPKMIVCSKSIVYLYLLVINRQQWQVSLTLSIRTMKLRTSCCSCSSSCPVHWRPEVGGGTDHTEVKFISHHASSEKIHTVDQLLADGVEDCCLNSMDHFLSVSAKAKFINHELDVSKCSDNDCQYLGFIFRRY